MRARNLKPGFFVNSQLVQCEAFARLLFAGLWCEADREGRLRDDPLSLKMKILPGDNCNIDALLQQLHDRELIVRYSVDGKRYIQINTFLVHQKPHIKEVSSTIPSPDEQDLHQPRLNPDQGEFSPIRPSSLNPESPIPLTPTTVGGGKRKSYPDDFEDFWKIYPKNGASKSESLKSYDKALKETDHATIIRAVPAYAEYLSRTDTTVAHATTWLSKKRWEVDHDSLQSKPAGWRTKQLAGILAAGSPSGNHIVATGDGLPGGHAGGRGSIENRAQPSAFEIITGQSGGDTGIPG